MPYLLIPNRHTGHRATEYGKPRCGAIVFESVLVDELPTNRVPCQMCEPVEATPAVEVKNREANQKRKGARKRRSQKSARTR